MAKNLQPAPWPRSLGKAAAKQAGLLLLLSFLATTILWTLREEKLPLLADPTYYQLELTAPLVAITQAMVLYDAGEHLFVDVRSDKVANGNMIPGAFIIRESTMDDDLAANMDFLFPDDKIILYGSGDLMGPANIAARLQDRGFQNLVIMKGGLEAWKAADGPVSQRTPPELENAS